MDDPTSGGFGNLLAQAQKMQERLKDIQDQAAHKVVEGSAGGGVVTVRVNGLQEVLAVRIDPSVADPKDVEMLQDLVVAATNVALQNAREMMTNEMSQLTGGMNIPGLF
jgi:DNA-binding YbaB/EbfC family protein